GRHRRLPLRLRRDSGRRRRLDVRHPGDRVRLRRGQPGLHGALEPLGTARHHRTAAGGGRPRDVGQARGGHARPAAGGLPGTGRRSGGGRVRSVLYGVGVGPGDPDLVTVRAADLLAKADVVFVPVAADPGQARSGDAARWGGETGRAEQTVLHYAEAWRVERVVFALHDREHTTRREQAWDAAAAQVTRWFAEHPG